MTISRKIALSAASAIAAFAFTGAASAGSLSVSGIHDNAAAKAVVNVGWRKERGKRYRKYHYSHRYGRRYVEAPYTWVDKRRGDVEVDAPYSYVRRGRDGVRVRAPFVDIYIPR